MYVQGRNFVCILISKTLLRLRFTLLINFQPLIINRSCVVTKDKHVNCKQDRCTIYINGSHELYIYNKKNLIPCMFKQIDVSKF